MGTIAQANASIIYVGQEATWGTQSTANYNTLRVTNFRFRQRTDTVVSNIITPTREPGDVIRVDLGAEGSFDFEMDLRHGSLGSDEIGPAGLFKSLFGSSVAGGYAISVAADVTTVVASNTAVWVATGSFTDVKVGDWLLATGFANAANDGWYYVSDKSGSLSVTVKNPNAVAETTATTVTIDGYRYVFGSTIYGMTFEQKIPSSTPLYHRYLGMVMGGITLNMAPGSLISGTMNWLGKSATQSTSSGAGTPIAQSTASVLSPVDNITAIYETQQGLTETWKVANLTLNIANDFAPRSALGSLGAVSIRMGRANVTGTMRIYAEHTASEAGGLYDIMASYLAGTTRKDGATTPGALGIVLRDSTLAAPAGYATFMLHEYFITDAQVAVGGNNEDLFLDVSFTAQVHPSTTIGPSAAAVGFSYNLSS